MKKIISNSMSIFLSLAVLIGGILLILSYEREIEEKKQSNNKVAVIEEFKKAEISYNLSKYKKAIERLNTTLNYDPSYAPAYVLKSKIYLLKTEVSPALHCLESALLYDRGAKNQIVNTCTKIVRDLNPGAYTPDFEVILRIYSITSPRNEDQDEFLSEALFEHAEKFAKAKNPDIVYITKVLIMAKTMSPFSEKLIPEELLNFADYQFGIHENLSAGCSLLCIQSLLAKGAYDSVINAILVKKLNRTENNNEISILAECYCEINKKQGNSQADLLLELAHLVARGKVALFLIDKAFSLNPEMSKNREYWNKKIRRKILQEYLGKIKKGQKLNKDEVKDFEKLTGTKSKKTLNLVADKSMTIRVKAFSFSPFLNIGYRVSSKDSYFIYEYPFLEKPMNFVSSGRRNIHNLSSIYNGSSKDIFVTITNTGKKIGI